MLKASEYFSIEVPLETKSPEGEVRRNIQTLNGPQASFWAAAGLKASEYFSIAVPLETKSPESEVRRIIQTR